MLTEVVSSVGLLPVTLLSPSSASIKPKLSSSRKAFPHLNALDCLYVSMSDFHSVL